jgi:RNA polymerase sigma factor FliA
MPINAQATGSSPCPSATRGEVIERTLPLVKSIAARLKQAHGLAAPFEDLYGLGVDGLLRAAERFDPTRGVAFTTFAYYRIRGAILDSLRKDPDRIQIAARAKPAAGVRSRRSLEPANDNGRAAGEAVAPDEPWALVETTVLRVHAVEDAGSLSDDEAPAVDEQVERRSVEARVAAALARLPQMERRIVEMHYYADLSFAEIGARLGICKPWAFRLHARALRQLKASLAGLGECLPLPSRG